MCLSWRHVVGREPQVVLDVAVAGDRLRHVPLELAEDQPVGLVQDVGQDVEPAPVRHAHDDLEHAVRSRPLDHGVEQRDEHLAPFEREPLLAHVVLVQEVLEQLGGVQLVDDPPLLLEVERGPVADRLHPVEQPVPDVEVADVHELDADRPAVRLAEDAQQLAEAAVVVRPELAVEDLVQVALGQAKGRQLELLVRLRPRRQLERIEVGQVMAHLAVGVDQPRNRLDRLLQGRRSGVADRRLALDRLTQLVTLEEVTPGRLDRIRVSQPVLIIVFDQAQVAAIRDRRACHCRLWPGGCNPPGPLWTKKGGQPPYVNVRPTCPRERSLGASEPASDHSTPLV